MAKGSFVFVVEGHYRSDRHPSDKDMYWGPILHPREERYAIFENEEDAQDCITFIESRDLSFDVSIMGNDFPESYKVTRQSVR